ncbi:MAG TPA: methyltransferase domain-containing protein [bacterium]|jgi:ubiquinone/menaquinone biosynthesis C-methylase UbiE
MSNTTSEPQLLPKGAFSLTHAQQLAAVPPMFRKYWESLAKKNHYYNHVFMADWANGLEDALVLEAGCGQTTTLAERKVPLRKLIGLEPIHEDILMNPTVRYKMQGILERLPLADGSVEGVYCDSVFEHITDPKQVCGEFYRVLKPGGRVIINTNSVFNPFMFPNKFLSIDQREWLKKKMKIQSEGTYPAPYRINTRHALIKYLKGAGFKDIKIYRWGVPNMYHPRWFLGLQLLMELMGETPLFCGLKHRLMATCRK